MVTVLFADIVDSTGHSRRLDAERAREVLGQFFGAAAEELLALRGRPERSPVDDGDRFQIDNKLGTAPPSHCGQKGTFAAAVLASVKVQPAGHLRSARRDRG